MRHRVRPFRGKSGGSIRYNLDRQIAPPTPESRRRRSPARAVAHHRDRDREHDRARRRSSPPPTRARSRGASATSSASCRSHPYLELSPAAADLLSERTLDRMAVARERSLAADLPPMEQFDEARRALDAQEAAVFAAIRDLPSHRWGFVPRDPWSLTLLTSFFLHADWMHLLGNMLFLWITSPFVEDRLGRPGFAAFYLAARARRERRALDALSRTPTIPLVGASGAIAGLMGAFVVFFAAVAHPLPDPAAADRRGAAGACRDADLAGRADVAVAVRGADRTSPSGRTSAGSCSASPSRGVLRLARPEEDRRAARPAWRPRGRPGGVRGRDRDRRPARDRDAGARLLDRLRKAPGTTRRTLALRAASADRRSVAAPAVAVVRVGARAARRGRARSRCTRSSWRRSRRRGGPARAHAARRALQRLRPHGGRAGARSSARSPIRPARPACATRSSGASACRPRPAEPLAQRADLRVEVGDRLPQHRAIALVGRLLDPVQRVRAGQLEPAPARPHRPVRRRAPGATCAGSRPRPAGPRPTCSRSRVPCASSSLVRGRAGRGAIASTLLRAAAAPRSPRATASALCHTVRQSSVRPMSMKSGQGNLKCAGLRPATAP